MYPMLGVKANQRGTPQVVGTYRAPGTQDPGLDLRAREHIYHTCSSVPVSIEDIQYMPDSCSMIGSLLALFVAG